MNDTHEPGRTTATASREPQDFTQPVHLHNIEREMESLLIEARSNSSHRAAKTLSKDPSLNVVLMAIQGGSEIKGHSVHGSALLQNLRGQLKVQLQDREVELGAGEAISFASRVPHRLAASEDTVLLLVLAGSD
jgi:quercetin dioxygenase-like cupin family protein